MRKPSAGKVLVKILLYSPILLPGASVGIFLTATGLLAPIGLPLLFLVCWPVAYWMGKYNEDKIKWANRDHPLETGEFPPWLQPQAEVIYGEFEIEDRTRGRGAR